MLTQFDEHSLIFTGKKYMDAINKAKSFIQYLLTISLCIFLFFYTTESFNNKFSLPFNYDGDAVFAASWIKSIIDNGWYLKNPSLGGGFYNMALFPMSDTFHFLILKFLTIFSNNYAFILNLFFLLTFPSIAIVSLFLMKKLNLNFAFALTASLLFTFTPYHFEHGMRHIFLSSYYTIPLIVWICVFIIPAQEKLRTWFYVWLIILSIMIGSSGIYYAFFGLFFIFISGVITSYNYNQFLYLKRAFSLMSIIFLSFVLNIMPFYLNKSDQINIQRFPYESELFGLKIAPLMLPVRDHKIAALANLRNNYYKNLEYATISGPLGILGDIGFILLLGSLLVNKYKQDKTIQPILHIARLNMCAILLATAGGFGTVLAYTISPMIRCYDRMSIFIVFLSLFSFFFFCQKLLTLLKLHEKKIVIYPLAFILLMFGIYDQTSPTLTFSYKWYGYIKDEVASQKSFIKQIESVLPKGSYIFQLPYIPFPEANYDPFKPYLYSKHLRWSFGAMYGLKEDQWQRLVITLSLSKMIDELKKRGVVGIYIDRTKFPDKAVNFENNLKLIYRIKPLESINKQMSFYDLRQFQVKNINQVISFNEKKLMWKIS